MTRSRGRCSPNLLEALSARVKCCQATFSRVSLEFYIQCPTQVHKFRARQYLPRLMESGRGERSRWDHTKFALATSELEMTHRQRQKARCRRKCGCVSGNAGCWEGCPLTESVLPLILKIAYEHHTMLGDLSVAGPHRTGPVAARSRRRVKGVTASFHRSLYESCRNWSVGNRQAYMGWLAVTFIQCTRTSPCTWAHAFRPSPPSRGSHTTPSTQGPGKLSRV